MGAFHSNETTNNNNIIHTHTIEKIANSIRPNKNLTISARTSNQRK
jgi:hypothetical protein